MARLFRKLCCALAAATTLANSAAAEHRSRDHDDARGAVEAGEIRPLTEILNILRGKLPGDIVRVKVEHENGRWTYEFRAVDNQGRLFEVYVDGRTGEIVRTKEK